MFHERHWKNRLLAFHHGELPDKQRTEMAQHLETCMACRNALERLAKAERALIAAKPEPPILHPAASRERFQRALAVSGVTSRRSRLVPQLALGGAVMIAVALGGVLSRRFLPSEFESPRSESDPIARVASSHKPSGDSFAASPLFSPPLSSSMLAALGGEAKGYAPDSPLAPVFGSKGAEGKNVSAGTGGRPLHRRHSWARLTALHRHSHRRTHFHSVRPMLALAPKPPAPDTANSLALLTATPTQRLFVMVTDGGEVESTPLKITVTDAKDDTPPGYARVAAFHSSEAGGGTLTQCIITGQSDGTSAVRYTEATIEPGQRPALLAVQTVQTASLPETPQKGTPQ